MTASADRETSPQGRAESARSRRRSDAGKSSNKGECERRARRGGESARRGRPPSSGSALSLTHRHAYRLSTGFGVVVVGKLYISSAWTRWTRISSSAKHLSFARTVVEVVLTPRLRLAHHGIFVYLLRAMPTHEPVSVAKTPHAAKCVVAANKPHSQGEKRYSVAQGSGENELWCLKLHLRINLAPNNVWSTRGRHWSVKQ